MRPAGRQFDMPALECDVIYGRPITLSSAIFFSGEDVCHVIGGFQDGEELAEVAREVERLGVNFTNILRAAFALVDPKSAKKTVKLSSFFALLGSTSVKAARRTLVKLNPGRNAREAQRHSSIVKTSLPISNLTFWPRNTLILLDYFD